MEPAADLVTLGRGERDWAATALSLSERFKATAAAHDSDDSFVSDNYAVLREAKLFSAGVPAELDGGGASYRQQAEVLRILAKGCGSTALALAMHTHPVALTAWRWRHDQAPVEPLLRRIAAEELILVSSGGSDWLQSAGVAQRVEGGFKISAVKRFASGSPMGDILMTSAVYDDPAAGPTVLHFGLPLRAPGVLRVENWQAQGMRGTGSGDVQIDGFFLTDAAVGAKRLQGTWHRLFHIIAITAFPLIYQVYLGVTETACELALDAARRRPHEPDMPGLVGAMTTELLAARLALGNMVDQGENAEPGPASTSRVFALKSIATRAMLKAFDHALAITGGAAFRRDHPLERLFRDIQAARFHPLSEAAQIQLTGREAMGLPIDC